MLPWVDKKRHPYTLMEGQTATRANNIYSTHEETPRAASVSTTIVIEIASVAKVIMAGRNTDRRADTSSTLPLCSHHFVPEPSRGPNECTKVNQASRIAPIVNKLGRNHKLVLMFSQRVLSRAIKNNAPLAENVEVLLSTQILNRISPCRRI